MLKEYISQQYDIAELRSDFVIHAIKCMVEKSDVCDSLWSFCGL